MKIASLLTLAVAGVVPVYAQVPQVLFSEGDTLGPNNDVITQIVQPAVNDTGGFLIRARFGNLNSTSPLDSTDFVYGRFTSASAAGLLLSEGTVGGETILAYGSGFSLANNGNYTFGATLTPTVPRLAGAFVNGSKVAKSGDPFPVGLGFDGQFWGRSVSVGSINDAGDTYLYSTVNASSALPSGETRAVLLRRSSGGTFTKLLETGQSLGAAGTISATETGAVGGIRASRSGNHWASLVDTNSAPTSITNLIVKDGAVLTTASGVTIRTGDAVPVVDGGQAGEVFASIGNLSLNDSGSIAYNLGFNGGDEAQDETIWVDGTIRYREGQTVDGKVLGGLINNLYLNNSGDLLYSYSQTGLFVNNTFVAGVGTPVDTDGDGAADTALSSFSEVLGTAFTNRDAAGNVGVYFLGRTSGSLDRLFKLSINLGGAVEPKWLTDGSGAWEDPANWQGGIPNAAGAQANFTTALTADSAVQLGTAKTVGSVSFDSIKSYTIQGAGLTLHNNGNAATISLVTGSHTLASAVTATGDLSLSLGAGQTLSFSSSLVVAGELTVSGGGSVLAAEVDAGELTISNGSLGFSAGGLTNRTTLLQVDDGSTLAFGVDSLVVDYTGATPIAGLIEYLLAGKLTAQGDVDGLPTYLAMAEAVDLGLAEFGGRSVDDTTVVIKFTFVGDANLDGQVDALDYERVDLAIGNTGVFGTAQGDLNYDGSVDALDYEQIDLNIGNGVGTPLSAVTGGVFIPEPAGLMVLAMWPLVATRRRR